jgi:hypothetical protein
VKYGGQPFTAATGHLTPAVVKYNNLETKKVACKYYKIEKIRIPKESPKRQN